VTNALSVRSVSTNTVFRTEKGFQLNVVESREGVNEMLTGCQECGMIRDHAETFPLDEIPPIPQ
jgi:hypothetical protein